MYDSSFTESHRNLLVEKDPLCSDCRPRLGASQVGRAKHDHYNDGRGPQNAEEVPERDPRVLQQGSLELTAVLV